MVQHAVVVVHGVGDPQPGDALQNFVNAYCALTQSRVIGPMQLGAAARCAAASASW